MSEAREQPAEVDLDLDVGLAHDAVGDDVGCTGHSVEELFDLEADALDLA